MAMKDCTQTEDTQGYHEQKYVADVKPCSKRCTLVARITPRRDNFLYRQRDENEPHGESPRNENRFPRESGTRPSVRISRRTESKKQASSTTMCHPSSRYSNIQMTSHSNRDSISIRMNGRKSFLQGLVTCLIVLPCIIQLELLTIPGAGRTLPTPFGFADASLIIGDSAIEIHEVDTGGQTSQQQDDNNPNEPAVILGTSPPGKTATDMVGLQSSGIQQKDRFRSNANMMPGPLPPLATSSGSPGSNVDDHNQVIYPSLGGLHEADSRGFDKAIAGKVVDFELTPAGGHNKAKIKKKKKKKKKKEQSEMFKKWAKKKKEEKKAMEKEHKESVKNKKEEGKKKKKKWGHQEHGLKKKGKFKKKKWGKKVKKGKGVKKGKKGRKFLKDKGHKNTGFKKVYHKEEYGVSKKWHDIKREKKWDEKSKKWKKKWDKEKGKKYKGDHMKKFEKKKKGGKKYHKEKKDKYKKFKKEKFEKGKKKKMEEYGKKKEGGKKKKAMEMKKKKKKKKKKP